jgi:hypothetical protein
VNENATSWMSEDGMDESLFGPNRLIFMKIKYKFI